ncbi:MAG: serine/threonine-protein kinase, partial [Rudaea sp.]
KAEIPDVRTLNAEVDPELERILSRMVAKDPAERYQSCQELVADLAKQPALANNAAMLSLPTQAATMEPLRMTQTRISRAPIPLPADATFAAEPATALRAGMAASSPMLRRAVMPGSRRKWAIGAAVAAALAVSAWAFRSDLPFVATPTANDTAAAPDQTAAPAAESKLAATPPTPVTAAISATAFANVGHGTRVAAAGTDNGAADSELLDSLWLNDVPDEALDPDNYDYAAAAYLAAPGDPPPAYAPVAYYPPYAVPAIPVAYYAPSPWRFGFGLSLGLGVGWWAAHSYYAPVYVGPAIQPGFAWSRPLPGSAAGAGTAATSPTTIASRPLPGTSVATSAAASRPVVGAAASMPVQASRLPATNATASAARSIANNRPAAAVTSARANVAQRNPAWRNPQAAQERLAAQQARRAQMRERQQARIEARQARQAQVAQRRATERENRPHPRPKRH